MWHFKTNNSVNVIKRNDKGGEREREKEADRPKNRERVMCVKKGEENNTFAFYSSC